MAKISLISQTVSNVRFTGVSAANPPHIHIIANQSFTASTGERIEFGSVQGNSLIIYLDVPCTMSGVTVTVPQITIDSTLDSADNPFSSYSFYWYRVLGNSSSFIGPVDGMANLQVPATIASASGCSPAGTCCNWTDLIIYNQGSIPLPLADFYTKSQVDAKILANLISGAPATATYIVKTATGSLTNAQSLGLLTTGLLKNTVGGVTGTLSTAIADTDYQSALSVTAPLTLTPGPPDVLAMTQASSGVSGFLLGADWTTFNNKANAALSNLSAVAVNASLIPGAAGTLNLGSTALPWLSLIIGSGAANSATFTGTFTGNRSVFVPDAASSLGQQFTVVSHQFLTSFSATTGAFTAAQPAFTDISGSATGAQMPATVVQTNQANTYTAGAQDFSGAPTLKIPVGAGLQPAVNGQIAYDSTANRFGGGQNSLYATFLTPASTDTLTNKTWNGVVIGTQYGGLGANESAASGVLSLNAGTVVNNSITTNGVAFGAAGNVLSFTSAVANALVTTSAGSVPAAVAPNATNLTMTAGVLNTIQNIATTSTPQFAAMGLNQGVAAVTILGILGPTMTTQSDQSVGSLQTGLNLTKNDGNTRTFFDTLIKPTINTGAGNSATTLNVLTVDTINTVVTGVTTNLLRVNYGGANQLNLTSGGALTVATSLSIAGGTALTTTNQTGTGSLVLATSPTLVTPALGVATATTINGLTISTSTGTLTIANGKTATVNNSLTFAGVDGSTATFNASPTFSNSITFAGTNATTMTFPGSSDTVAGIAAAQTLTNKTITSSTNVLGGVTATFGSDGTGDVYYRNSGGILTRLAIGTTGQALVVAAGLPSWGAASAGAGGSNTQVQYNSSNVLTGSANFTWTNATNLLTIANPALNSAPGDSLQLANTTAAIVTQNQLSPSERWTGTVWDPTASSGVGASENIDFRAHIIPASAAKVAVTNATNATPIVITIASDQGWVSGQTITVGGVNGNTNANTTARIYRVTATTYQLLGTTGNGAFSASANANAVLTSTGRLAFTNSVAGGSFNETGALWAGNLVNTAGIMTLGSTSLAPLASRLESQDGTVDFQHLPTQGTLDSARFVVNNFPLGQEVGGSSVTAVVQALVGAVDLPSITSPITTQVNGVAGYVRNGTASSPTQVNTVAVFGQAAINVTGICQVWGANFVANNGGFSGGTLFGTEIDVNSTTLAPAKALGLSINGVFSSTPTLSHAIDISLVSGVWQYGLFVNDATVTTPIRIPYAAPIVARNQAAAADVPIAQLATLNQTNVLMLGTAASVTTTTAPINGMWVGATSHSTLALAAGTYGFQGSDSAATIILSAAVAGGPSFRTLRADGTSAGLTAVASGDVLGSYQMFAYDGTGVSVGAIMRALASETWTNTAHGTHLQFFTVPATTTASVEVGRWMDKGPLQISNNAAYGAAVGPAAGDFVGGSQAAVALYVHGNKFVISYNRAGTVHFLTYDLAAGAGSWADGTTAP